MYDRVLQADLLGVSGLILGPVLAADPSDGGLVDALRVDPRLGEEQDLRAAVLGFKYEGLKVLMEASFALVSRQHPDVARALLGGPDSPEGRLFDIDWDAPGGPRPRPADGAGQLVRLNQSSDEAVEFAATAMLHWLSRGVDGFSLSSASAVPPEFWRRALARTRELFPYQWVLADFGRGDLVDLVERSTVDSAMQFDLRDGIVTFFSDRNLRRLDRVIEQHNRCLESFVPQTFLTLPGEPSITRTLGEDNARQALALLLFLGGAPSVDSGYKLPGITPPTHPILPWQRASFGPRISGTSESFPAIQWSLLEKRDKLRGGRQWRSLERSRAERLHLSDTYAVYQLRGEHPDVFLEIRVGRTVSVQVRAHSSMSGSDKLIWG